MLSFPRMPPIGMHSMDLSAGMMRSLPNRIGVNMFCAGMQVYYNIQPHQTIEGLTSAQMAQIPINLSDKRWMTMIELAAKN